jgi:hypothetical protein
MDVRTPPLARRPPAATWPISRTARKTWLVVHILSGGAWIGIDVLVAVLVGAGMLAGDTGTRGLAYRALAAFVAWPMLVAALVCLLSGLVLGLGTRYGLLRFWWVAAKLVINVVLCVLIVVLLLPGLPEVADYGASLAGGRAPSRPVAHLFMPPLVSLVLLSVATLLSVFKPWGRIRRPGRPA